jgi:exodeoxyribonuclease V alpha subunit
MSADTAARALTRLHLDGALRTVDMAFARLLRERLGADAAVALAGALAMRAVALGDSGFAIGRADALLDALDARATLPEAEAWRDALRASPWVSAAPHAGDRALLCFAHDRVALRRYAQYEQRLAARLHLRLRGDAEQPLPPPRPESLALLRALFGLVAEGVPETVGVPDSIPEPTLDRQALAAWLALRRRLALITGGPGTGKTTTVARLLALLVAEASAAGLPPPRIALAAPTGRAAVRLGEAIAAQLVRDVADGRLAPALAEAVPARARTVHRLLGSASRHSVGFRHHAGRPLPADVIVVDEASMIDLPLMTRLLDAVPVDARLILLGDPDQLPAVEAGDVLGALCAAAGDGLALPAPLAAEASQVLDAAVPATRLMDTVADAVIAPSTPLSAPAATASPTLPGTRVHLLRGWRQAGAAGLQALAAAVQAGDAEALFATLDAGHADLHWRPGGSGLADWLRAVALPSFEAVRDAADPVEALERARALRLLTALRRGPAGAEHWNAWCAAELGARTPYFHGALIAIGANSPRHGLSNGDLGVAWADDAGDLAVHVDLGGRWAAWRPAQLPPHALAFASTVHKAQGAEFARVALVLPGAAGPGQTQLPRALSRELLYTAITRARSGLLLWAAPEALRVAVGRRSHRDSGLGLALAETD